MSRDPVPGSVMEVVYYRGSPSGLDPILKSIKATLLFIIFIVVFSFEVFAKVREIVGAYSLLFVVSWLAYLAWVWVGCRVFSTP